MGLRKRLFGNNTPKELNDDPQQEIMHSLCLGIVGDTGRLLSEQGYNKLIIIIELIVFGMFIVAETYSIANRTTSDIESDLDEFHRNMANYVFNEYLLKQNPDATHDDLFEFHDRLHSLVAVRYSEYRKALHKDLKPGKIFRASVESLLGHLFVAPLDKDESQNLVIPLATKLASFYTGCLKSFKEG